MPTEKGGTYENAYFKVKLTKESTKTSNILPSELNATSRRNTESKDLRIRYSKLDALTHSIITPLQRCDFGSPGSFLRHQSGPKIPEIGVSMEEFRAY